MTQQETKRKLVNVRQGKPERPRKKEIVTIRKEAEADRDDTARKRQRDKKQKKFHQETKKLAEASFKK